MFHVISKLLHFLTQPIIWISFLLLLGLITKSSKKRKRLTWLSLILLFLFSNQFVFNSINRLWEPQMTDLNSIENKYEIGVILGGYSVQAPRVNQVNFSESADRFTVGLQLYRQKKIKKIMLCGGHGSIYSYTDPEGKYIGDLTLKLGVPKRDIIIESNSKNTHQNAVECKKVLDSLNISQNILLITSTTHMPRSMACFKKVGIDPVPVAVDGSAGEHVLLLDYLLLPDAYILLSWNKIFHEWLGLIAYKIAGYT